MAESSRVAQTSITQKRKRSVMTLETKMKIVHEIQTGSSQRVVAEKFGIAKSTVGDIWKDRQKIEDCISSSESLTFAKKRCIVREPKYDLIDSACWQWFCQQRAKGAPVSGVLLQEKARVFFVKFYPDADPETFKGSTGWLRKFEEAHSITPREAFNALDISLQWLESQGTDPAHLLLVKKWRDTAARMRHDSLRQTNIFTYCTRTP